MIAEQTKPTKAIALIGSWNNTDPSSTLIRQVVFWDNEGQCMLRISGGGAFGPVNWGEAPAFSFSEGPSSVEATAFTAKFDRDRFSSVLHAYVVKGVLVIISMSRFYRGAEERGIFVKEFFYRGLAR